MKCGKPFKYRGPRVDNSVRFCSEHCPAKYNSPGAYSFDPFKATKWKVVAGGNSGYLVATPMTRISGGGWRVACRGCGRRFEIIRPGVLQADVPRGFRRARRGCRPHGPDQHGPAGKRLDALARSRAGATADRSARGPNIAIGTPERPQVASRVISGGIARFEAHSTGTFSAGAERPRPPQIRGPTVRLSPLPLKERPEPPPQRPQRQLIE